MDEEVKSIAKSRAEAVVEKLRILVATPYYGGSLPIAHYCASAFGRLGHRVEVLDNSIFHPVADRIMSISRNRNHREQLLSMMTTLMANMITAKALDQPVDLVWLVAQSPMALQVAAELKRQKIPTAFWFVEEWQMVNYWRQYAPLHDYFFTVQGEPFLTELRRIGIKNAVRLPLAADPSVHKPLELSAAELAEYGSDVSHVGFGYRNRRQVFSGLAGFDFKLWGNGWNDPGLLGRFLQRGGARLSTEESVKVFNATRININLHTSQFHDDVNPDGDYLNPRTYELAASGAFQIVDRRRDLDGSFVPGREVAVFESARELAPMIQHYLDHPDERRAIAQAGRARALADHTYDQRMNEALKFIYSRER